MKRVDPARVLRVRMGHGANCSSIGSVVDTLFVSAAVGGALFAAVCAAMETEPARVVGDEAEAPGEPPAEHEAP